MKKFYIYHKDLGKPVKLKHDPEGWNTGGKTRKRDLKWHGVFFEYSPRLRFVKDGRNILAYFYERYGIEADLTLLIYKFSKKTRRFELDYKGRFNLSKLKITTLFAECNIEQTGFVQKFKNRQEVKVDLSSLVTQGGKTITPYSQESIEVELPSKVIRKLHDSNLETSVSFDDRHDVTASKFLQVDFDNQVLNEIKEKFNLSTDVNSSIPVNLFKVSEAGSYTFDLRIEVSVFATGITGYPSCDGISEGVWALPMTGATPAADIEFYIKINDDAPILFTRQNFVGNVPTFPEGVLYKFDSTVYSYNQVLTLNVDDKITIYGDVTVKLPDDNTNFLGTLIFWGSEQPTQFYRPTRIGCNLFTNVDPYSHDFGGSPSGALVPNYFKITADTIFPQTTCPLFLKHELLARIVESITDEKGSFKSNYYGRIDSEPTSYPVDGEGSLRGVSDGQLIRGFPLVNNPVHCSWKEVFESLQAIDGVGVGLVTTGVRQQIQVEPIKYFYNTNCIAQFKYVKDITKEVADDLIHNELEAGYNKWSNEFANNLDEFATKRGFILPITQIKSKLVLKSSLIASGYTWEFVRRDRYNEGSKKDNDLDNDNFIIQLKRSGGQLVVAGDDAFAELINIISPETVYNPELSVMRNILRNGSYIRAALYHHDDEFIKLSFGEGNTDFSSRLNSELELLSEKQIQVKFLSKPIWLPEIYSFKVKPTEEQNTLLDSDPYGFIEFSSTDRNFKRGYILETKPDDESDLTEFIVLRANI